MVRQVSPRELAKWLANGHTVALLDVRQAWENQLAALPDSKLIPLDELANRMNEIAPLAGNTMVVYSDRCRTHWTQGVPRRTASLSSWDYDLLPIELGQLQEMNYGPGARGCACWR
jgi:hypothetical protein